jgi:hypothetical protein
MNRTGWSLLVGGGFGLLLVGALALWASRGPAILLDLAWVGCF